MWIVMTSAAHMPSSCSGQYKNVALVQLNQHYTARNMVPKMISERARGVLRVRHYGHHNVGKTARSAFYRVLAEAERHAAELNNAAPVEHAFMSWGGSA